ncbi:MAG: class I SAM-dependent methyltransferase [Nanoarchaeota archaeon]|nr:class I SAM-dependent methyltransferase [Nanoarchaeota archaeon]
MVNINKNNTNSITINNSNKNNTDSITTNNHNNKNTNLILSKLKEIHKNSPHNSYWNISWDLGEELSKLIKINNPKNILEIGTSNGFSTLWMAKEIDYNSKVTTIEVDKSRFDEAKNNFILTKTNNNVLQIQGEIFDILNNSDTFNTIYTPIFKDKFDFIFLDAAQRRYLELIQLIEKLNILNKNSIIVADNVISHNNMNEFLAYMKKNYECKILEKDSGFLIAKSKLG